MAREDAQIKLRLPDEMKAAITKAAEKNGRSMNAEIVARLERTMDVEEQYGDLESVLADIFSKIEGLESEVNVLSSLSRGRDPYNRED